MFRPLLAVVVLLHVFPTPAPAQEDHVFVYVDQNNPGPPPGTGIYTDPFHTIADAIHYVWQHDFILVRPGTYHEVVNLPYFVFLRSTHGPELTTIDATGLPGTHAVTMATLSEVTGFTIVKGDGAGVLAEVVGGAGAPAEYGRVIRGNRIASCPQGGLHLSGPCHPVMVENVLVGNGAFGLKLEEGASPYCVGNTITLNAAGILHSGPFPDVSAAFANNIVWGNGLEMQGLPAGFVTHSDIGDPAYAGVNGNFTADPLFECAPAFDLRLRAGSPCLDAADTLMTPYSSVWDWRGYGALRKVDGDHNGAVAADIGALERGGLQIRQSGGGLGATLHVEIETGPWSSWLLATGVLNQNPTIPIPGAAGYLYLETAGLLPLLAGMQGAAGRQTLSFVVTDPGLLELRIPLQVLAVRYGGPQPAYAFTNAEVVQVL